VFNLSLRKEIIIAKGGDLMDDEMQTTGEETTEPTEPTEPTEGNEEGGETEEQQ